MQSMLGLEKRSTMDIDLQVIKINLEDNELINIFKEISEINLEDEIEYSVMKITNISLERKYHGKSITISAKYYNVRKVFSIDLAIGDIVTPSPKIHIYRSVLNDIQFEILSYPVESILAEKIQTLIYKGERNSRSKDLLDIHLLEVSGYNSFILNSAMINTFFNRGTMYNKNIFKIINDLMNIDRIELLYNNYAKNHIFAKDISFNDCKKSIQKILECLQMKTPINVKDYNIELHLIRHGKDEPDKLGGWSSTHLINDGIEEVELLKDQIDDNYDLFVSSDLTRAIETSNILNKKLKMNIDYNENFRETNNGDLKDLTKKQFEEKYNGLYYSSLDMNECYPNGESPNQFYERVKKAFIQLIESNKNKKILLVTHGGVITVIMCLLYGLPYSNLLKIAPPTGSITKF